MIDPHKGDTGNKVENARRCRRLFMAIVGQALKDAESNDQEIKAEAINYLLDPERSDVALEVIGLYPYAFRQKIRAGLEAGSLESITDTLRPFYEDSRVECGKELEEILHGIDYSKPIDIGDTLCEKA